MSKVFPAPSPLFSLAFMLVAMLALSISAQARTGCDTPGNCFNNPASQASFKFDLQNPTATCGDVLYFAGGSALDGPAYYTDTQGNILCKVGGTCRGRMAECRECDQKYWSCPQPTPAKGR